MNNLEKLFSYEGNEITFKCQGGITYVNATEMAKPFGKKTAEYLRLQSTSNLINAIVGKSHFAISDLVISERGGINPRTLLHEDIALDFAQWLSIDFKLWCNDRLKELLTKGITALPSTIEDILSNPDNGIKLLEALKSERLAKEILMAEIKQLEPKRIFAEAVSASKTSILVGELAKILKQNGIEIGQNRFFEYLRDKSYLIKRFGTDYNMPTQKSMDLELFEIKETSIVHPDGHTSINKTSKVTGKGQVYFINQFLNKRSA